MAVGASYTTGPRPVSAAHFTHWVHVKAPFAGKFAWATPPTDTYPTAHGQPYGGDWSTDYYAVAGTAGALRISSSAGYAVSGYVLEQPKTSCLNPNYWAGWKYKIRIDDSSLGARGWYVVSHVSEYNGPGNPYYLSMGQTIYNGTHIGWTAWWQQPAAGTCYQVTTSAGVHWHVEMYNYTHYSCFYPYVRGQSLTTSNVLGAVGANGTGKASACWTPPPDP
jgi:hypothetical protein